MIELIGVWKRYGDVQALKDVSFTVKRGEILTLLGPNGSGKTTLLKLLAALESPSQGEILFDGVRLEEGNAERIRKRATLVFQSTVLFKGSVYDNASYGLRLRGISEDEIGGKVGEALELVGLESLAHRKAKTLSGGERQRLSLARAIVLGCEVLLLDEPTANLDPESLSIVKDVIKRLGSEESTTVVLTTHNLEQAQELSDRVLLMKEGEIVEAGAPRDLFLSPSDDMARFARLENVFTGVARVVNGVTHVDIGGGVVVAVAFSHEGRIMIHVRPEDVIISRDRMLSSARNSLPGNIVGVEDLGSVVRMRMDVGRVFTVQITRKSLEEMGLNVGQKVYLTFKASSVRLL
ncbi:MAG: ABC transporter ATP-binding protein [Candidatus Bathyarchaeota archaeon]|nr:MAG: ABC transporter ATP-binding protein [Candidatus Bathyarchaeota archaeon]